MLFSGLIALIIAWVSSYNNFVSIESHVIAREQDQLLSLAETVADNVSNKFDQLAEELEILSRDPDLLRQLKLIEQGDLKAKNWMQLEHYYKIKQGEVFEVGLLDSNGHIVYAFPNQSPNDQLVVDARQLLKNPKKSVGQIYSDSGQFFVHVLRPLDLGAGTSSILYAQVPIESLYQSLIEPIRAGAKGYASVKDATGVIVMHPNRSDIGKDVLKQRKNTYPDFDWSELESLVEKQIRGESGVGIYHSLWFTEDSSERVKKFNAFSPAVIGDSFWIVNISKDYDEVVDFLKYRTYGLWAINLSVLFVVFLTVYFYDRQIKHKRALRVQEALAEEVGQLNSALEKDLIVRRRIADEMEKRKEWYEGIFNGVSDGIVIVTFDQENEPEFILDANEPLSVLFGYTQQQLMSMRFFELLEEGVDVESLSEQIKAAFKLKSPEISAIRIEAKGIKSSQLSFPIELDCQLMRYNNEWRGILRLRDITKVAVERELSERAMARFKGLVAEIAERIDPDILDNIASESSERYHIALLLDKMNLQLEKLYSAEVAENRRKEALMVYQSRMAAMGEMLANIAHQWRQPLSVMHMLFDNLKDAYVYGDLDIHLINRQHDRMVQLTQHMSRTIDDFHFFFKPQKLPQPFLVSHAIGMALALVEEPIKNHHILLSQNLAEDALLFNYESQLSQVLLALIQNSIDALSKMDNEGRKLAVDVSLVDQKVIIVVQDNAGGVPSENLPLLFEPYFSTKENQKGMGLGLSIAKMIIEQHYKGSIEAINKNLGLAMILKLPTKGTTEGEGEEDGG